MRLLREPLFYFLVVGAVLFFYGGEDRETTDRSIILDAREVQHLAGLWEKARMRPPTEEELEEVIENRIREEVYYREALRLGLDQDDVIIRRRLRQKMEFVADEIASLGEPTHEELVAHYEAFKDKWRPPITVTLEQLYFDSDSKGERAAEEARQLLSELREAPDQELDRLGDQLALPTFFESVTYHRLTSIFGPQFTARVQELPTGEWAGPVASGYGVHLVRVVEYVESPVPPFADIQEKVALDWLSFQQRQKKEAVYQALLSRYHVTVEHP